MNPFIQRRYVFRQMYARCVLSNNALLRPTMEQPISPFRSDLPPNLTILGLENAASRRARGSDFKRNDLSKPRLKSAGQKTQITRLEKKIKFFSGIPVNNVDRLNKHGKPLIKNVLSSCVAAGNYGAAVVACEEKLQSGESIDGRMLTTMIRTFGSAGDPDKAIARKF